MKNNRAMPNEAQFQYQKEELAAFIHFGPNTFHNVEWGEHYGDMPAHEVFPLKEAIEVEPLMATLKEAGFHKVIVTAKHHDGFAIWRSRFTDYEIGHTQYRGGQGDVLAELSAAATKYGLAMGLYLSPWDIHEKSYGYYDQDGHPLVGEDGNPLFGRTWEEVEQLDVADYNEFYRNQLEEILSNPDYGCNGRFTEIWLDGAKGSGAAAQRYKLDQWIDTIQRYQGRQAGYENDALLFGAGPYTSVRWIGNESGFAHETTWAPARLIYDEQGVAMDIDTNLGEQYSQGYPDGDVWTVPEADARITSGWFWGPNKKRPKSLDELTDIYLRSVGHGATLLLNVPLNQKGKVDQDILNRVREFGDALKNTFTSNLAQIAELSSDAPNQKGLVNLLDEDSLTYWTPGEKERKGSIYLDFGKTITCDLLSIEEAIQFGQHICHYQVKASLDRKEWTVIECGTTIGAKRLIAKEGLQARFLIIQVQAAGTAPFLNRIGVYQAAPGFRVGKAVSTGITKIALKDQDCLAQNTYQLQVQGQHLRLMGEAGLPQGSLEFGMDDYERQKVDFLPIEEGCQVVVDCPLLGEQSHTIDLCVTKEAAAFLYLLIYDQGDYIEFDQSHYKVLAGNKVSLVLRRIGESKQAVEAWLENNPGSAVQGDYDTSVGGDIVFEAGETECQIEVATSPRLEAKGSLYFTLDLVKSSGATLGACPQVRVAIES